MAKHTKGRHGKRASRSKRGGRNRKLGTAKRRHGKKVTRSQRGGWGRDYRHKDGLYKEGPIGGNDEYVTDQLKDVTDPDAIRGLLNGASRFKGGVRLYEITTDTDSMTWKKVNTGFATTARSFVRFGRSVRNVFGESAQSKKESIPATIDTIYGYDRSVANFDIDKIEEKYKTDPRATAATGKSLSDAYSIFTNAPGYDYLPETIKFSKTRIDLVMDTSKDPTTIQLPIRDIDITRIQDTFWQNIQKVYAPTPQVVAPSQVVAPPQVDEP
jgi:hypothetical protein